MERSGFGKTSPSLARRGGDARRRRRRRQPFRRERLRRASTTLRAVTTGRSRARSQPTIHMPTSLPISHRSRGARVTCTLVLLFGGGVHTVFSPAASLFFLLYTDECRKIDRALLLLVSYYTHSLRADSLGRDAALGAFIRPLSRAHNTYNKKPASRPTTTRRPIDRLDSALFALTPISSPARASPPRASSASSTDPKSPRGPTSRSPRSPRASSGMTIPRLCSRASRLGDARGR